LIPHVPKQKKSNQSGVGYDFKKIFEIMFAKGIDVFYLGKILVFESSELRSLSS
jgi:hypothetical protein